MTEKFYIDYNTGAGNEWVSGTLEEAMQRADDGVAYTQQNVCILNEAGDKVAERCWIPVEMNPDTYEGDIDQTISYGSFGFYDNWDTEF